MSDTELVTLQEAAKLANVSYRTIHRKIDAGELHVFKSRIGTNLLVKRSEVLRLREVKPIRLSK